MCQGSIGSDAGGSIRIPASYCGIAGLRPTIGRIPCRGSVAVSQYSDTVGPMAARVADVARIFTVIAGHDPDDPMSEDHSVQNVIGLIDRPRAGRSTSWLTPIVTQLARCYARVCLPSVQADIREDDTGWVTAGNLAGNAHEAPHCGDRGCRHWRVLLGRSQKVKGQLHLAQRISSE
jgi:hypothetical protein